MKARRVRNSWSDQKVHLRAEPSVRSDLGPRTACGRGRYELRHAHLPVRDLLITRNPTVVTCGHCRRTGYYREETQVEELLHRGATEGQR